MRHVVSFSDFAILSATDRLPDDVVASSLVYPHVDDFGSADGEPGTAQK